MRFMRTRPDGFGELNDGNKSRPHTSVVCGWSLRWVEPG
jgi:hypothetical protein